jgi:hypothetical protein
MASAPKLGKAAALLCTQTIVLKQEGNPSIIPRCPALHLVPLKMSFRSKLYQNMRSMTTSWIFGLRLTFDSTMPTKVNALEIAWMSMK